MTDKWKSFIDERDDTLYIMGIDPAYGPDRAGSDAAFTAERVPEAQPLMALLERNMAHASQRILSEGEPGFSAATDPFAVELQTFQAAIEASRNLVPTVLPTDASFRRSAAIAETHEVAQEIPVTEFVPPWDVGPFGMPSPTRAVTMDELRKQYPDSEIPVTAEMKAAGAQELKVRISGCLISPEYWAAKVYRAMAAAAPKPAWHSESTGNHSYIADLRDKLARKSEAAMRVSDDKDATIAALRAQIAAFVDPDPEPSKPNPFRDFLGDPRRIGGMS